MVWLSGDSRSILIRVKVVKTVVRAPWFLLPSIKEVWLPLVAHQELAQVLLDQWISLTIIKSRSWSTCRESALWTQAKSTWSSLRTTLSLRLVQTANHSSFNRQVFLLSSKASTSLPFPSSRCRKTAKWVNGRTFRRQRKLSCTTQRRMRWCLLPRLQTETVLFCSLKKVQEIGRARGTLASTSNRSTRLLLLLTSPKEALAWRWGSLQTHTHWSSTLANHKAGMEWVWELSTTSRILIMTSARATKMPSKVSQAWTITLEIGISPKGMLSTLLGQPSITLHPQPTWANISQFQFGIKSKSMMPSFSTKR